ncbi:hypothetical protein ACGFIF_25035 [Kribbella sp. NPDC049174]|uniref:hypothetical protein n=1 Tax=Kribbella sp. NPDC049174 TaxID=3364112 RepID=UPI0037116879
MAEPYRIRPATAEDVGFLADVSLATACCGRLRVRRTPPEYRSISGSRTNFAGSIGRGLW